MGGVSETILVVLIGRKETGQTDSYQLLQEEVAVAEAAKAAIRVEIVFAPTLPRARAPPHRGKTSVRPGCAARRRATASRRVFRWESRPRHPSESPRARPPRHRLAPVARPAREHGPRAPGTARRRTRRAPPPRPDRPPPPPIPAGPCPPHADRAARAPRPAGPPSRRSPPPR